MKNLFEGAVFGSRFRTRSGELAIFGGYTESRRAVLAIENRVDKTSSVFKIFDVALDGRISEMGESGLDIIQ